MDHMNYSPEFNYICKQLKRHTDTYTLYSFNGECIADADKFSFDGTKFVVFFV